MEEKVIVVATPLIRRFEKYILEIPGTKKIKQVKNNTFFWMDNGKSNLENVDLVKETIKKAPGGTAAMFKVYPVYKGKVDMDFAKPASWKDAQSYYQGKPDITEAEMAPFAG